MHRTQEDRDFAVARAAVELSLEKTVVALTQTAERAKPGDAQDMAFATAAAFAGLLTEPARLDALARAAIACVDGPSKKAVGVS